MVAMECALIAMIWLTVLQEHIYTQQSRHFEG